MNAGTDLGRSRAQNMPSLKKSINYNFSILVPKNLSDECRYPGRGDTSAAISKVKVAVNTV